MKPYLLAAAVILTACGGNDATSSSGNPNTPSRNLSASAGTTLSGFFGNYLTGVPQVTLTDASGHPVAGVAVTFVAQGGGNLTGAMAQTDSAGRAHPSSWRLGRSGTQSVTASSSGLAPVTFNASATAPPPSTFHIEVRYAANTTPTAAEKAAFDAAAARWSTLILRGGPPTTIQESDMGCGDLMGQTLDGVVITAELTTIDGKGKILGSSAPCILRDQGYLPIQGYMQFDTADLAALETSGQLDEVILHEMAHVLGFGTIWEFNPGAGSPPNAFLLRTDNDPAFTGAAALAALFGMSSGFGFSGKGVPVEATGGAGTAFSHWRETTFGNELMTGFLGASGSNPLSALTVEQFHDLGYVVNDALADGFSFAAMVQAFGVSSEPIALVEGTLPMPIVVVDRTGHEVRRIPRV
jgi:hypothetical protein